MNEATNKAANIRSLDYVEHDNYAIVVDKFIKMDLVYYLNTNPKFVPYNDSYQEPYLSSSTHISQRNYLTRN